MCGIAGMIGLPVLPGAVDSMKATMVRRGPDAFGTYIAPGTALLHARLAVIDLEGGKQPMELDWAGEHYVLVYNGELYNTVEIRQDLIRQGHRFSGHSDTEVVLHAFAQWGEKCLYHFNGIFAFCVWMERARELFAARDRIGVKPFFYMEKDGGLLFASEIKTILAYPGVKAELDAEGAAEILLLGPGRTPGSGVFRGIRELEPGCCGWFSGGRMEWKRYWKLRDREHTQSFEETAEYVRFLVTDAVKRQMVSDVPIGTFLSGGLDSSLISAICAGEAARQGKTWKTFSVDYVDNDKYFTPGKFQPNADGEYIRIMQEALHSDHSLTVLTAQELSDALEDATRARDLPGMADVDFSLLLFCRRIRDQVTVALSGECADEIFGGYPWYRDPQIRAAEGFPWAQTTHQRLSFLLPWLESKIDGEDFIRSRYQQTLRESDILPGTSSLEKRMKEMMNLNFRWFMQTLLDRKDRMSMYWGLEVRVPFCDHRIAEYLYGVPWEFKDSMGMEKGLLRHAMRGILPDRVLQRKKSPYPKTFDPKYLELMTGRLKVLLQDWNAPIFHLVRREALEKLLNAEFPWPWYGQLMGLPQTMAYMLQIDFWLREYQVNIL